MAINNANIPLEMKRLPQWVVHRNKIPHNPGTGYPASVTDPATWGSYEAACAAAARNGFDGIGFVFTRDDPFVGIDFDHCLDNGQPSDWVSKHLEQLASYTEISPSGTGLHVICCGSLPGKAVKTARAEMYEHSRYFTITGNTYGPQAGISSPSASIQSLYNELVPPKIKPPERTVQPQRKPFALTDQELIDRAKTAKNGFAFQALWDGDTTAHGGDHSRADLALCNHLAYWTNGDADRMDRLFRMSGLMREKWDRPQVGSTYGRLQVEKAISEMTAGYDPEQYRTEPTHHVTGGKISPPSLAVINAAELSAKQLEPIRFFVDNLLPQGLALLVAPPKYGKSWFVLDLCLSVANGEPFLGRKTTRSDCLYLALEDSEYRLQDRMHTLLAFKPAPANFNFILSAPNLDNGLLESLEAYLAQFPSTGLIVIDTLQKIRGASRKSESVYAWDYREVGAIKAFADRHKILILLVHHTRKMDDDSDPHNRISGTNGIMGAADTSLVLTRQKRSDANSTLSITGRDVDGDDLILTFDKERCKWSVAGTPDEIQQHDAKRRYLDNPLVQVIRSLVFQNNGKWRGRMKALNEASSSILGDQLLEESELRKYPGMIKAIKDDLEHYDGITYRRMGNGTKNGSGEYVFSAAAWEEYHTETTIPYCGN